VSAPASFDIARWAEPRRSLVDALLARRLLQPPRGEDPGRLVEAIRYSLLAPGKRLRPLLALAAAEAVGGAPAMDAGDGPSVPEPDSESAGILVAAAAVELVHCYSLVHDDLPAMDDDDVRRGQATNHKVFGEATAILVGDALLTLAFEWLAETGTAAPAAYLRATLALARGAGMWGMVRGQARDLGEPPPTSMPSIERLHREKTGALFRAAVEVGAAVAGGSETQIDALARFAERYGVAFQHADDRDDGEHAALAAQARRRRSELLEEALAALEGFDGRAEPLRALARALDRA
jgi:geranylgeranyl diphosphate synthase type II